MIIKNKDGSFEVEGSIKGKFYKVEMGKVNTCECMFFAKRGQDCKHIIEIKMLTDYQKSKLKKSA